MDARNLHLASSPRLRTALAGGLCTLLACGEPDAPKAAGADKADKGDRGDKASDARPAEPAPEPAPVEEYAWELPQGMRAPEVPADNPMTAAKVELGHQLFMDKRLSVDGTRSCYSCHQNELGNADGRAKALGPGDKLLARNTPTIWNVAYHTAHYWDGRAASLEKQAIGAWKGGNMAVGEDKLAAKAAEIGALPEYAPAFAREFGLEAGEPVLPEHVAKALSAYERTLLCGATAWDKNSMNEAQQRGWELFRGKGSCTTCHSGDNFSDDLYHKMGIGLSDAGEGPDKGRMDATKDPADLYKFRTPTLRNVTRTAPYFHDGSVTDLRAAVKTMAGGPKRPDLDPNYADRNLSDAEIDDLVAFLGALDCPGSLATIGDQSVPGITSPAQPAAPAEPTSAAAK
ncbi:cytochrome-c peroxidase [Nannocystis bainbridge]|uniref:Cytochrome c peroxidase n=1 Tax=Nannocystis bainbridge TaxID=2995303 RepID=A0ABT5DV80_9BACT|nr:cytochrome c peroxidase [Nannocystis bainbridge]MDC0717554.1 cytochrome c peroxidase [Nannocystis bainbridge]